MKKILYLIPICLLIVGCGTKKIENIDVEVTEKYSLVSTGDRLVFESENNYEIVYFEGNKIVKVETAIKFPTEEEAKQYYKEESISNSDVVRYAGDVFIVEETEDYWEDYKDLSREELKEYMKNAEYTYIN